jgi:hypothetical protein
MKVRWLEDWLSVVLAHGSAKSATLYATVSASYIVEQMGLPTLSHSGCEEWNGDSPSRRLEELRLRERFAKD